jgi:exopolysaccharide biosynthesis polyprenyl glycosylphosphotransferase
MRKRDTFDVLTSCMAIAGDAVAVFVGFMTAIWIRFDSGWLPVYYGHPPRALYLYGTGIATLLFLFIFRSLGLYVRPQLGTFSEKIPRLVRATFWGIFLAIALAFIVRTEPPFSRIATALSFITVLVAVLIERLILFRVELHMVRRQTAVHRVLIVGCHDVARHLRQALEQEPRLRSRVVAFLRTTGNPDQCAVPVQMIRGSLMDLERVVREEEINHVILADSSLSHDRMVEIILECERQVIEFSMVPDIFRVLTSDVAIRNVDGVPLLGVGRWPLDHFWNRVAKRAEDMVGSLVGLVVSCPVILVAMMVIKRQSPGPVFYRQERCGENGRVFALYKLRTMHLDAEEHTGPVWAVEDDPRRIPVGRFLRQFNLDELPQFWNVLKGEMSLVGPRPERPHFVEQFREDISRYMWRHVSKPGMTGWAQVNGLRGNTSIKERIKYDLYYLENWSLAFDFKILIRTFFSRDNAY